MVTDPAKGFTPLAMLRIGKSHPERRVIRSLVCTKERFGFDARRGT
jgi:hypothetical protein